MKNILIRTKVCITENVPTQTGNYKWFQHSIMKVYCNLDRKEIALRCYDHGQYPWGRHQKQGLMAAICLHLGINTEARNTCLVLHIFIALLYHNIVTVSNLLKKHRTFVKNLLSATYMREDIPTLKAIFKRFNIKDKVCIRRIVHFSDKGFVLLNDYVGNFNGQHF